MDWARAGIILHSQTKDSALDGLPHAYALDDTGRFPCNSSYNFSDYFAARFLDVMVEMGQHVEASKQIGRPLFI